MNRLPRRLGIVCGPMAVAIALAAGGLLLGAGPASGPATRSAGLPPTVKAGKTAPTTELKLSGVFEAAKAHEIALSPAAWAELRIRTLIEHGAIVKKGDALIELDTRKIDKALVEKAAAVEAGAIALKQAEEELRALEKATPEQLALTARAQQRAEADLERFTKIDRPLAEKAAQQALKTAVHVLEYAREELRQLEKMYKADDLTEETEEIVLKRQRYAVERAEFALQQAEVAHEQKLKIDLPRQAEDVVTAKDARDADRAGKDVLLPLALAKKRLDVEKARRDQQTAEKELADLKKDRQAMLTKAPADGIVYYGQCIRGQWTAAGPAAAKLVPGGLLAADQVVMTVIEPKALAVRATVPEKDLHLLRKGLAGQAVPTGFPNRKLKVELTLFSAAPNTAGQFEAVLAVAGDPGPLRPGMTCALAIAAKAGPEAILLPQSAVFSDPARPGERFIYLKTPGQPQKRIVKVGASWGGKIEILDGLNEGEEVFTRKPE